VRLAVRATDDVGVEGEWVELAVHDRGRGIPPEVLDRIFEPFFTTKAPQHGTGLGLTVVHGIAQAHGGFVRASSDADRGTELAVRLPRAG
jgi:signal transduction histidine kinase